MEKELTDYKTSKLQKIKETEEKLGEYRSIHKDIKEGTISRFTKNTTLSTLKVLIYIFALISLIYGIFGEIEPWTRADYFFNGLFSAILFFIIGKIIKSLVENRKTVSKLSKLLDEVIKNMELTVAEEKKRYTHLVDEEIDIKHEK